MERRRRLRPHFVAGGSLLVRTSLQGDCFALARGGWGAARNKKASSVRTRLQIKDRQRLTLPGVILVPSALAGLTALFGMGRGDPRRYSHLKNIGVDAPVYRGRRPGYPGSP